MAVLAVLSALLSHDRTLGLSPAALAQMGQPVVPALPGTSPRGLGWELLDWPHGTVLSHDGANTGQCAALRALPSQRLAGVVLTNWARAPRFTQALTELEHS